MKIIIDKSVFAKNDVEAQKNRRKLDRNGLVLVNVMASPGAGKTSVIVRLLKTLSKSVSVGVIEGDVASSIDAEHIEELGFRAVQINTAGACHLTAATVGKAIDFLDVRGPGILFVENIGNLICPADFALGEQVKLVIASVPEGHDKPAKYPAMFAGADCVVLNKTDLAPHVRFSDAAFEEALRAVNDTAPLFRVSCVSGKGIPALQKWLLKQRAT